MFSLYLFLFFFIPAEGIILLKQLQEIAEKAATCVIITTHLKEKKEENFASWMNFIESNVLLENKKTHVSAIRGDGAQLTFKMSSSRLVEANDV